jgi:hypothetical protein
MVSIFKKMETGSLPQMCRLRYVSCNSALAASKACNSLRVSFRALHTYPHQLSAISLKQKLEKIS